MHVSALMVSQRFTLRDAQMIELMLDTDQRLSFCFNKIKERKEHTFPFSLLLPFLGNKINEFFGLFLLKQSISLNTVKKVLQAGPSQKSKRRLDVAKKKTNLVHNGTMLFLLRFV